MIDHNIDIIYVQEHIYLHYEDMKYHDTDNGWQFVSAFAWNNSVNTVIGGIGMLIGPRALKLLYRIPKIQPRMMVATFNDNPSTTLISCYDPTNVGDETTFSSSVET